MNRLDRVLIRAVLTIMAAIAHLRDDNERFCQLCKALEEMP